MVGFISDREKLVAAYRLYAYDGKITAREVKKTVKHAGGGAITEECANELLHILAGEDGIVSEQEFVDGILEYVRLNGYKW